jgi:hypothetical protein
MKAHGRDARGQQALKEMEERPLQRQRWLYRRDNPGQ